MKTLLTLLTLGVTATAMADRPNILLVLADDLGYGDLACYGSTDVKTPNLDKFASEGLKFTDCYAGNANCSPSRTAIMTGRTPTRVGVRNWIPEDSPMHVRQSEMTIARLLRQSGYATCHSGKWHMNGEFNQPTQPQPNDHGFDHWFSTQNNAYPNHHNPDNFVRNGAALGKLEGYAADLVTNEAIQWLDARDKEKPFFLYVCYHEPHEPIASDAKYTALYPHEDPAYSAHHGNITQMDDAFGRLMKKIDESGLRENTLVFFTSDNGPAITSQHPYGSAGPLRDKKGTLWEGGIRVPGMLRWPGKTKPGTTSGEPISGVDFLPTFCAVAGITPPQDRTLDGASWLPVLEGGKVERQTPLYWQFNNSSGEPKVALRVGDWKILATLDSNPAKRSNDLTNEEERWVKEAELQTFMLYNLRTDIAEKDDLSASAPGKLQEMKELLQAKYADVKQEAPMWPAWKFTGAEGKKIVWPDYVKKKKAAPVKKQP